MHEKAHYKAAIDALLKRLAEYEDLELTPDEIMRLKRENEQLKAQNRLKEGGKGMIIRYRNRKGKERIIRNVIHIQNIDNEFIEALVDSDDEETLTLRIEGIEEIFVEELDLEAELKKVKQYDMFIDFK